MWLSFMNRNRPFNVNGSFPLCCTSGDRVHFVVSVSDRLFWCISPPQGPYRDDSNHLAMFKAVLKKNRDGSKGGKKDSGTVCRLSDGKLNDCFQATAGPAPQNLWMLCKRGNFSKCLSHTQIFFKRSEGRLKLYSK